MIGKVVLTQEYILFLNAIVSWFTGRVQQETVSGSKGERWQLAGNAQNDEPSGIES